MANKQTETQPSESRVIQKLRAKPIKKIALIDDAFDALNKFDADNVKDDQIRAFLEAVLNRNAEGYAVKIKEYRVFCKEHLAKEINSLEEFEGDDLLKFWKHRDEFVELKSDLETLFAIDFGKLRQVESIRRQLVIECTDASGECLVEIETHDSQVIDDIKRIGEPEVVLLDYFMGDESNADKAKENAEKIAQNLYDPEREKSPLVILMSSKPSVIEAADKFQKDTQLLKGLFHAVKKDDLNNAGKLRLNLLAWIERLDKGIIIHNFANAVGQSLKNAADSVAASIRNLSLEDYAYVSDFSLKTEGQPLGEYMTWLFNAYVGRLAFELDEEAGKRQAEVDEISFSDLPVKQFMPSDDLIEMYDSALFNKSKNLFQRGKVLVKRNLKLDELKDLLGIAEGRNIEGAKNDGDEIELPHLRLGLLFYKDENSPVLMVINADCDLTFTEDGKRIPSPVVTLISGKLMDITASSDKLDDYDTEFFKVDKKTFHIDWDVKYATHIEIPQLSDFFEKTGYQCAALLKMPFVLKIQQEYAAHFSRIGLPVAPPIQHAVKIRFYYKNLDDGTAVELPALPTDSAFLIKSKKDEFRVQCRVTIHFLNHLLDNLETSKNLYQDELERHRASKAGVVIAHNQNPDRRQQALESAVNALNRRINKFDIYGSKNVLHTFTREKTVEGLNNDLTIAICRNANANTFTEWKSKNNSLILICVEGLNANEK